MAEEVLISSGAGGNKAHVMEACCICGARTTRICTDDDGIEGYVCQKCFLEDGYGRLPHMKLPAPICIKDKGK